MVEQTKRTIFFILGWLSIALAIAGIPLPILPTTPFVLLAAFFFSKSSERWHQWLLQNKHLGPMVKNWERHGVISVRAKVLATIMMILLFGYTLIYVNVPIWIKCVVAFIGASVMVFIHTRPSSPQDLLATEKTITN
jgi:uncharacterized membrane protein YbaN (DUF454 family)